MDANVSDWLHLFARWFHLVAGIMWIGTSFYFMWLDDALEPPRTQDGKATGECWLVHSGGYYHVVKNKITPGGLPDTLHWFKWEAGFTWMSGIFLLTLVYYLGGGAYLLDPEVSSVGVGGAVALGVGVLVAGWLVYDQLVSTKLAQEKPQLVSAICCVALLGVVFLFSHVLSGRAAFIHVGALLGTLMVGNVFVRIIPGQEKMVAAAKAGLEVDHTHGEKAKLRSVHNNYMTFPLLIIMLSNHFPTTYGHKHNWLVLSGLILAGAGVRHFMNSKSERRGLILVPVGVLVAALVWSTAPASTPPRLVIADPDDKPNTTNGTGTPTTSSTVASPTSTGATAPVAEGTGSVKGVVLLEGAPPAAKEVALPEGCSEKHHGPLVAQSVLAKDGKLQDAFVWIKKGLSGKKFPVPETEVVLDQKGCVFAPHVLGVRAGQKFVFVNSDPLMHNIHGTTTNNGGFNEALGGNGARAAKTFPNQEVTFRVKCDVHPWMSAYVGVVNHPFFAVTGANGEFILQDVPAGDYTLGVWHESLGTETASVSVRNGVITETTFKLKAR
ncbi:MAG: urate hydroxylase PuuD [Planctomycetota bacterium]